MGQDHSTAKPKRKGAGQQKPAESTAKESASIPAPAPTQTQNGSRPPAKKTPVPEPVDVVITATAGDSALVSVLKTKIEAEKYTVYSNTSTTEDSAKEVGRMLVDAKILIFVASEESLANSKCGDQVSLAYISNKPILLAATKQKEELTKKLNFGLKLTLEQLHWTYFESDQPDDDLLNKFIEHVHQYQRPVTETVEAHVEPSLEAPAPTQQRRIRMNTKLRTQTGTDVTTETVTETFWERNFGGDTDKVKWFRFQQCFISDYDTQLKSLFTDEHMPWLLEEVLHISIFGGADEISKEHFMQVRGDSAEKHGFWRTVRQIAVEKFNMKEVFNMQSSVRLTAVENLGKFQNPAVIEALLRLLEDPDPNIRAVAAISLGHTGIQEDSIIDRLIGLLKDSDRIVRQSACLTLGSMKAKKAIPHISNVWRNDFISVVRDAARTALEKMEVPEAQEVLKVTRVLEAEIKHLEGKIVQV